MLANRTYEHAVYCSKRYRTKNAILMFGDDFAHPEAEKSYSRMDEIISILKHDHSDLEVSYSTFAHYFDQVMA